MIEITQKDIISKYLKNLRQNIEPTKKQKQSIKERVDKVRMILNTEISYIQGSNYSSKTYLHGSWKRRTQIRKSLDDKWDVDIMVAICGCMPASHPQASGNDLTPPRSVLRTLKSNLDKHYRNTIRQDRPCITIEYQADNLDLEIMPIYFGDPEAYDYDYDLIFIPNSNLDGWIKHFPFRFKNILTHYNQKFGNVPISLIKLIKHWKNQNGKLMRGYDIELLTIYFFNELESLGNATLFEYVKWWFKMAQIWVQNVRIRPIYDDVSNPTIQKFDQKYHDDDSLRERLEVLINQTLDELEQGNLDLISKRFPEFRR